MINLTELANSFYSHLPTMISGFSGMVSIYAVKKSKEATKEYEKETSALLKKILDCLFLNRLKTIVDRKLEDKEKINFIKDTNKYKRKQLKFDMKMQGKTYKEFRVAFKIIKKEQKLELSKTKLDLLKQRFKVIDNPTNIPK